MNVKLSWATQHIDAGKKVLKNTRSFYFNQNKPIVSVGMPLYIYKITEAHNSPLILKLESRGSPLIQQINIYIKRKEQGMKEYVSLC
jgi:hypothetical protein